MGLDHSIGPDLDPNCLQRLSAEDKSQLSRKELIFHFSLDSIYNSLTNLIILIFQSSPDI